MHPGPPAELRGESPYKMVVNPLYCFALGGNGSCGPACFLVVFAIVGCAGVLATIDLLALPVQAAIAPSPVDLDVLSSTCPIGDPVARVGSTFASDLGRFGFTQAPPGVDAPEGALPLILETEKFTITSAGVRWRGVARLYGPDGRLLWTEKCDVRGPPRETEGYRTACDAARSDLDVLAARCSASLVASVERMLRQRDLSEALGTDPATAAPSAVITDSTHGHH